MLTQVKKVVPVSRRPFPYRWYLRFVVVWRNLPGATTTGTTVESSILHCRTNCMVTGSCDACARAHCGELFAEFYYLPLCGDACLSRKQAMVLRKGEEGVNVTTSLVWWLKLMQLCKRHRHAKGHYGAQYGAAQLSRWLLKRVVAFCSVPISVSISPLNRINVSKSGSVGSWFMSRVDQSIELAMELCYYRFGNNWIIIILLTLSNWN